MENIINYIAIAITIVAVIIILKKDIPAGYHKRDNGGNYVPVKTSLLQEFFK